MAKKGKGKGKGKKGGKSKKTGEKGGEKPKTEKELFELQVQELRQKLEMAHESLGERRVQLEASKLQFQEVVDSKESCVSHMKRVLQREEERRLQIQDKFQTERDLGELVERRALRKFEVSDRTSEATHSLFQQQKMELEGKLTSLEECRLARNCQRANLKKIEEALEEKIWLLHAKSREEDMIQVQKLLCNREEFLCMCEDTLDEWRDAFKLRMPVHAKKQLEENVQLRGVCRDFTQNLLKVQAQNRILKKRQKSLHLEEEIQSFAEGSAQERSDCQEKRLKQLSNENQDMSRSVQRVARRLMLSTGQLKQDASQVATKVCEPFPEAEMEQDDSYEFEVDSKNRNGPEVIFPDLYFSETAASAMDAEMGSIREHESGLSVLLDTRRDTETVLKDQQRYRECLEHRGAEERNTNGMMASVILRAGKIFESRCGKMDSEFETNLDFDVLHQIRMLLDL